MGRALADLTRSALRIGTRDVEVAKRRIIERIGGRAILKHALRHQLGCAIGIDRKLGSAFLDRHLLGRAVDRSGRREDEMLHARIHRGRQQSMARESVVAIIFERLFDAFGHHDRSGEMHDRANALLGEDAVDELRDRRHCLRRKAGRRERHSAFLSKDCRSLRQTSPHREERGRRGCRCSRRRRSRAQEAYSWPRASGGPRPAPVGGASVEPGLRVSEPRTISGPI